MLAEQARDDLRFAIGQRQREHLAMRGGLQVARVDVGGSPLQRVAGLQRGRQGRQQPFAGGIVRIDDGGLQVRPLEQRRLGLLVALHGAVVIEMIARQVGKTRHRDADMVQPALLDADGRGLQGHRARARGTHPGQRAVHGQHIRRGQAAAQRLAVGQQRAQGADAAARLAHAREHLRQPLGARGLAVGAGYRHHAQVLRRTAIPFIGQRAKQGAQLRDRQGLRARGRDRRAFGFVQDGAGATRQRLIHELATVADQAGAGDEHIARLDLARIQAQIGRRGDASAQPRQRLVQVLPLHGVQAIRRAHRAPSGLPATMVDSNGASGCTPISRRLPPTMRENTGAAMAPP
ncbi:Uncharacterised protein [Bordetella pertussis]|nr:Uncharacterised protein [Bordetella pertussis]CPM65456.1 Uncharacterised protein [Bordetella pertussis]CPQ91073.1 Uncharacterised protein [Bordetella pertussis]